MRLKIEKGKRRRLNAAERKVNAVIARRNKALKQAAAVLKTARKEVTRQVR